ncbi:hypothetical protein ACFFX0_14530 [Citricoccus parietis]|uniref:Uncharacterized protein n=1 Tax=Citricoccus parietis TaxID=592307 RepID=A0ABV5G0A6_9MICC
MPCSKTAARGTPSRSSPTATSRKRSPPPRESRFQPRWLESSPIWSATSGTPPPWLLTVR